MLPGASHSPSSGDSRASRIWPGEGLGCGDSREEGKQLHLREFRVSPGSLVPDQINSQHLMSPGKLKSGSCACVGIPAEHEHQSSGQRMCWKLGRMEGKGQSVRKRNRTREEHEGAEPHTQLSSLSASFL